MPRSARLISAAALTALVLGLGLVLQIASTNADRLIHRGPAQASQTPASVGLAYEDVALATADGLQLAAWYVRPAHGAVIVLLHGYHNTRQEMLNEAALLAAHGYGALLVEARAHGASQGDLITFGLKEVLDARAGLDFLLARPEVDPGRIGALGNSQGAVTLLLAAAEYPEIRAVAANSPYAALEDVIATGVRAATGLPPFPFALLIRYFAEQRSGFRAEQVAALRHIGRVAPRPVLLMQGGRDTWIPLDSGQRLYAAAGEPRQLWFDPEVGHAEFDTLRAEEYEGRVVSFFDEYLAGR